MMSCLPPAEKLSPGCDLPRRINGFHKQSYSKDKDTLEQPLFQNSMLESESDEHQQCILEGEKVIRILEGETLIKKLEKKPDDLESVSSFVQRNKETLWYLNDGKYLRICDLNGTIYMGQKFMLEGWQHVYLPKSTRMEILGTLECSGSMATTLHPTPWQYIILVAEDGKIYAYEEEEELHLVAGSLRQLVENGIKNTGISYLYPSDESDEESFQEDEDIQSIKQRTRKFVDKHADEFDDFLNFFSK
ncbi:uncharacterized protein LOC142161315 [Mixophyes fleayi]|uniref:uncharacterized protein LOC142161315 n=1 Tax=Mixophyes fleayi TaxID=3061075 RepID=UPI003F4DB84F